MIHCVLHLFVTLVSCFTLQALGGRVQQVLKTTNAAAGEPVTLPCLTPALNNVLFWKFQANGSRTTIDAAQFFPGKSTYVFDQFNLPPGRSSLVGGTFTISKVAIPDEGEYWCEIAQAGQSSLIGDRFPVHVWVTPASPNITPQGNGTVLEYIKTTIARCSSQAGKPSARLTWWNGTNPLPGSAVVSRNAINNKLWDVTLDLVLEHPTRFDHKRNFTCLVEHPAYKGRSKSLNHAVNVLYHPVNARIWANLTSLEVHCWAEGYPQPAYYWVAPDGKLVNDTATLQVPDLYSLPGQGYFECAVINGIPPSGMVKVTVDQLRWPDGKPVATFAGLAWYIWVGIAAGILLVVVVVIVVVCCCCCKKENKTKSTGVNAKYNKPILTSSSTRHSQPSLLEFDSLRTPDGREASLSPPSDHNQSSMARSYSLDHVVDGKYNGRTTNLLVPLKDPSRGEPHRDSDQHRRASFENVDQPTSHVEVLNQSWDNVVRSRDDLNRTRDQLRVDLPPRYQPREELRHEQPSHSRADDHYNRQPINDARYDRRTTNAYPNPDYYQHEIIPQYSCNDDFHGNQGPTYGGVYHQRSYHDDRYSNKHHHYNRSYEQSQYQGNRGDPVSEPDRDGSIVRGRDYDDTNYRDNRNYGDHDTYNYNDRDYGNGNYDDRNYGDHNPDANNDNDRDYGNGNYDDRNYGDNHDAGYNSRGYNDRNHGDQQYDFQPSMI